MAVNKEISATFALENAQIRGKHFENFCQKKNGQENDAKLRDNCGKIFIIEGKNTCKFADFNYQN